MHIYMYTYTYIYICMYVYIHICANKYIFIYIIYYILYISYILYIPLSVCKLYYTLIEKKKYQFVSMMIFVSLESRYE